MLWTIFVILLILWLLGLISAIGGLSLHLLLIAAGAVVIYNQIRSRRVAF